MSVGPQIGARLHEEVLQLRKALGGGLDSPFADDLPRFVSQFGIHELGALTAEQLFMFIAARNLGWVTARFSLPPRPADEPAPEKPPDTREAPATAAPDARDWWSEDRESAPIRSAADLAHIYPSEWRLRPASPSLFYLKVLERELRMPRALPQGSGDGDCPWLVPLDAGAVERPAPNAYVLVDCSQSMEAKDRRGVVARGAALAFLLAAWRLGYDLRARPFREEVGELVQGSGQDGLLSVTREVLHWENRGSTSIQGACATVGEEAGASEQRLDMLIVSDGISRLSMQKPVEAAHVHAAIIHGEGEEDPREARKIVKPFEGNSANATRLFAYEKRERIEGEGERGRRILRDHWCDPGSFVDVWNAQRRDALRPRACDVLRLAEVLAETEVEIRAALLPEKLVVLARRIENIAAVFAAYEDEGGIEAARLAEFRALLERLREELRGEEYATLAARNGEGLNAEERERRAWQEGLELKDVERLSVKVRARMPKGGKSLSLFELLSLLGRMLLARFRRRRG